MLKNDFKKLKNTPSTNGITRPKDGQTDLWTMAQQEPSQKVHSVIQLITDNLAFVK